jgi:hypothetical protein
MATGTFNNTGRTTDVYTAFGGAGRTQIRAFGRRHVDLVGRRDAQHLLGRGDDLQVTVGAGAGLTVGTFTYLRNGVTLADGGSMTLLGPGGSLLTESAQLIGGTESCACVRTARSCTVRRGRSRWAEALPPRSQAASRRLSGKIVNNGTINVLGGWLATDV